MNYTVRAFAELAGVTVKTLHHYERHGLLAPTRSRAGYRRYTLRDLGQLEAIIALKSLGLSLKQIATLRSHSVARTKGSGLRSRAITGSVGPAGALLRSHREQLLEKRRRLDQALAALDAVEKDADPASALRRFVAQASWTKWEAKRKTMASTAPRAPDRASASRFALFREIDAALDRDSSGEAARPLAARWDALVDAEAGDADTASATRTAWANRRNWPDGVRRYVASLYDLSLDRWTRAADAIDRFRE